MFIRMASDVAVTNPGSFGRVSFRPGRFGLGRFGLILGCESI